MTITSFVHNYVKQSPLAWFFFLLTLLLHISWPLTSDTLQAAITALAVMTLALSSAFSALRYIGTRDTLTIIVLVSVVAFGVEKLGSTTGFPFGDYSYTNALQPQIFAVPISVVFAWFAMTWVMCVIVHDVQLPLVGKAALAGLLLTAWDFYLDPQMTAVGYWVWQSTTPALPGIPGIPISNYLGWFISGTLMSLIVLTFMNKRSVQKSLAQAVLLWTLAGGFILHAIFWRNLPVGLWGATTLGLLWYVIGRLGKKT